MGEKSIYSVQSVERTLFILETIAACDNGIRLKDLAEEVKLNLSTCHRLVSLLEHKGYLEQDSETKKYFLGLKVLELQGFLIKRFRIADIAVKELKHLVYELGETTHLAVLSEGDVVYVESLEGEGSVISRSRIGRRVSIHATALGKVLTAWLPWPSVEEILLARGMESRTDSTITTPEGYRVQLSQVRAQGYALDLQENSLACICVAAPIRDNRGDVIAAVSVSCPAYNFSEERKEQVLLKLLPCTDLISRNMGYQEQS